MSLPSSSPSLPPSPHIVIAYETPETRTMRLMSGENDKIFSRNLEKKTCKGSIVVVVDTELLAIVSVLELTGNFEKRCLLDIDVYSGNAAKYNKCEAPVVRRNLRKPIPLTDVARHCGIPENDKSLNNNLSKRTHVSLRPPHYIGENSEIILQRYHDYILALAP